MTQLFQSSNHTIQYTFPFRILCLFTDQSPLSIPLNFLRCIPSFSLLFCLLSSRLPHPPPSKLPSCHSLLQSQTPVLALLTLSLIHFILSRHSSLISVNFRWFSSALFVLSRPSPINPIDFHQFGWFSFVSVCFVCLRLSPFISLAQLCLRQLCSSLFDSTGRPSTPFTFSFSFVIFHLSICLPLSFLNPEVLVCSHLTCVPSFKNYLKFYSPTA